MSPDKGPLADTFSCPPFLDEEVPREGVVHAETLPGGTRLFTDDTHRVGTDALLLAAFCADGFNWATKAAKATSAVDLGAGCGILILSLIDAGLAGRAVGVEQDPAGAALLLRAAAENGLPNLEAVRGDLRDYRSPRPFDLALANPPYFAAGARSPHPARAAARHGDGCSIGEVCAAAARLLRDRGRFCLCWPPDRLADAFGALRGAGLEPKRMQLVRRAPEASARLALLEARKGGGVGLKILPDRILGPGESLSY